MGQYYKIAIMHPRTKEIKSAISPRGAKLTEFGYINNRYVRSLYGALIYKPMRVVVSGDYAKEVADKVICRNNPDLPKGDGNMYDLLKYKEYPEPNKIKIGKGMVVINLSKREFFRYSKKTMLPCSWDNSYQLDPLVLLCADGNGHNGGDYYGNLPDVDMVGRWKFDKIQILFKECKVPDGFKEIEPHFQE